MKCFQVFSATDSRENDYAEGFANYWRALHDPRGLLVTTDTLVRIPPSSHMTVMFKPVAGLFQSVRKYLPLQFMPITIELSLVDSSLDPIITQGRRPDASAIANGFLYRCSICELVNSKCSSKVRPSYARQFI